LRDARHGADRKGSTKVEVKAPGSYDAQVDDWRQPGLSVGQVAERMGVTCSAVRWYDDHGLLPSERTPAGHRRFFADVCCRVAMIRAAQRVGLSISEIADALSALPPRQAPSAEDWERLATHLRAVAAERIEEPSVILAELTPTDANPPKHDRRPAAS
jgi:MerR family redox-sensitive transcriptional activator SoxR